MKNFTIICLALFLTTSLSAQITLDNSIFPAGNDVYEISTGSNTVTVTAASAEAQTWDYSDMQALEERLDTIFDASQGIIADSFPEADLVRITGVGAEEYLDVNGNQVSVLGTGFSVLGTLFPIYYNNPLLIMEAPLSYGDSYSSSISTNFAIATADFPALDTLIQETVNELGDIDSLRIVTTIEYTVECDAWGVCKIPLGDFDVLRLKETTTSAATVEAHVVFGPIEFWLDVTGLVADLPNTELDLTANYRFQSLDHKEPIFTIFTGPNEEVVNVEFKSGINTSNDELSAQDDFKVFPNPTSDLIYIETKNQDWSHFQLMDNTGRLILSKSASSLSSSSTIDLSHLPKALYFYNILDANGSNILGGKITVQ